MSFRDVYSNEVLESRRARSQRARFWGKVVSIVLMLTVAVTLRTEPQLRSALVSAAMAGAMQLTGRSVPATSPDFTAAFQAIPADTPLPASDTRVRDRIKINRPGSDANTAPQQVDVQALARDLQKSMAAFNRNGDW
ncbi:hypothetical protein [Sulfitobacter geojensis]|uniref:hypothetical protein n=1 Tax=Sulfitobacter geojensis TaxID=1342299 RepID=UPI002490CCCA|nr:hypothetical protein [Sulfitobacter geojensis]